MDLQLFAQERTEEATPKRLRESREKGQYPRSQDLVTGLGLVAAAITMKSMGPTFYGVVSESMTTSFSSLSRVDLTPEGTSAIMQHWVQLLLRASIPIAATMMVVGVVVGLLQSNFHLTLNHLTPKFERISPVAGFTRIFSLRTVVELFKSLLKLGFVGLIAYREISGTLPHIPDLMAESVAEGVQYVGSVSVGALQSIGLGLLGIGVLDYGYQYWEFRQSVMMTKQEIKDENKQTEGSPENKQRQRQKMREMARRRRALKEVPRADVIITNPTHYAIAVKYESGDAAPRVIAKGMDLLAQRIKVIAKKHEIPMVENRPLARTLYATVEIGKVIPPDLYTAVAEVLALVYSMRRQKRQERLAGS